MNVNLQTTLPTVKHIFNEDYFPIRRFDILMTTLPTIKMRLLELAAGGKLMEALRYAYLTRAGRAVKLTLPEYRIFSRAGWS